MTGTNVEAVRSELLAVSPDQRPERAARLLETHGEHVVCAAVELLEAPTTPRDRKLWRRTTGRFYTPPATARRLAERLLDELEQPPGAVLDPACGTGELLVAMFDAIHARWPASDRTELARRLVGIDVDPVAVAVTNARLGRRAGSVVRTATTGDALLPADERSEARDAFDVVIANPPFGNAIERETARTPEQSRAWRQHFPLGARGAYDRASLFVERALQLAAPGARIGFVLPTAWLVAPSSRALRDAMASRLGSAQVDPLTRHEFPSVTNTLALVCWTGQAATPAESINDPRPCLGDIADVRAGMTTAEAYEVSEHVQEGGEGFGLVTAGAIDPDVVRWGETQRYLGRRFTYPTLPAAAVPPGRRADCGRARVLVAALSHRLEAVAVEAGRWVAAVSVIQVFPRPGGPDATELAAILNDARTREEYATTWAGAALGGRSIPVTAGRLRQLRIGPVPVPTEHDAPEPAPIEP